MKISAGIGALHNCKILVSGFDESDLIKWVTFVWGLRWSITRAQCAVWQEIWEYSLKRWDDTHVESNFRITGPKSQKEPMRKKLWDETAKIAQKWGGANNVRI